MAWEKRSNGRWYYYRSRRVGGRVVKEYFGGPMVGDIAEEKDAERRSSRESEKEEGRRVLEPLDAIAALLDEVDTAARSAVRCALEGAGLHQHHRGEWRRRRGEAVNAYKAKPVVGEIRLTA